ncbi:MAG: imidazole glycerol phosphate synthase cyclase subunit [Thermodesulfobacteriota bacterium]
MTRPPGTGDDRVTTRIIPRLDIKGPNLVKGIHLEGLRVLGKPHRFARHYYESGADELIYMDVVASLYGRNSLAQIIEETSREIFIPLTVGGGLRTIEDIRTVLQAGADKVSINTAAIGRPALIAEASKRFGSSTIVVSIEAKKQPDGSYQAYTDCGRVRTGVEAIGWAKKAEELGCGEILLTSIDAEGTGGGFDLELLRQVSTSVSIPVIASGGAGRVEHLAEAVLGGKADAVCLASCLHYRYIRRFYTEDDYSSEGNVAFLRGGREFTKVRELEIGEIKEFLAEKGIPCRWPVEGANGG